MSLQYVYNITPSEISELQKLISTQQNSPKEIDYTQLHEDPIVQWVNSKLQEAFQTGFDEGRKVIPKVVSYEINDH